MEKQLYRFNNAGIAEWYDVTRSRALDKYVNEQGKFLG